MTPANSVEQVVVPAPRNLPRSVELGLFLVGCLWAVAAELGARVASQRVVLRLGLLARPGMADIERLFHALFLLTLLLCGFTVVRWIALREADLREVNALPQRATSQSEWGTGAAFGWALALLSILPMVLARDLLPAIVFTPRTLTAAVLSLLTLAALTLAQEAVFRGFLYERLRRAIGTSAATVGMAGMYALVSATNPYANLQSVAITFVLGLVLCVAYLRTHALWLPWGIHFAWAAATAVLFGLPLAGKTAYSAMVVTNPTPASANWVTGGFYGPEGAVLTAGLALALLPWLYRLTRDYAWEHTHEPIVGAAYAVVVQPPAAHTAMEEAAAAKAVPLVQIQAITSASASTLPVIEEHLRKEQSVEGGE